VSWAGIGDRWRSSPPPARPAHAPAPAAPTSLRGATDTTPRLRIFSDARGAAQPSSCPGRGVGCVGGAELSVWSEGGAGSQERCRELPATSSSESSCSSSGGVKEAAMDWSAAIAVWSCSRTGSIWGLGGRRRWSP
jgi:hypothetical protein